jgi:hypothetical protein
MEEGGKAHIEKNGRCRELFMRAESEEVETKGKQQEKINICHKGSHRTLEIRKK